MTDTLQPQEKGKSIPSGEHVFRLLKPSKNGRASEIHFMLSSEDEASELKSLSVWISGLTTPEEARSFFPQASQALYELYALLPVDTVRSLRPVPDSPNVPYLDVVFDPLTLLQEDGTEIPESRPGAAGHAGITGLSKPTGLANAKLYYRSLRSQLADLANSNLHSL